MPREDRRSTDEHTGDTTLQRRALPVQGEQHEGAKRRTEARPCVGHDVEDGRVGIHRDDNAEQKNGRQGETGDDHNLAIGRVALDQALEDVRCDRRAGNEQIGRR